MLSRTTTAGTATIAVLCATALPLSAQRMAEVTVFSPTATLTPEAMCAARPLEASDPAWTAVYHALETPNAERAVRELEVLEDSLRREVEHRPDDVSLRYLLAVSIGARADRQGGRAQIVGAKELHHQLTRILEMDPDHAGANHLMGRLHAAVLRLNPITRFLATRLLGAGELSGASWGEAERYLRAGVSGAPCVPDHHFELALLYAERGRPEEALEQLESLARLGSAHPRYEAVLAKAVPLVEDLARGEGR